MVKQKELQETDRDRKGAGKVWCLQGIQNKNRRIKKNKKINNMVMFMENLIRVRTKGRMPRISGGGVVQVNPRQSLVGHNGWF